MASHDPLAGAIEHSAEHKKKLTEMAGDLLTGAQVCELLCIGQLEVVRRRDAGTTFNFRVERPNPISIDIGWCQAEFESRSL